MTMKMAVMHGIGRWASKPILKPKDDEVLVKLEYVGICGSDMHYYETGAIENYIVKPPFVLGHEPGGVVTEVCSKVKHLKVGDRDALEPGKTCGYCEFCRQRKYNLCPDAIFFEMNWTLFIIKRITELTGVSGADLAIECAGLAITTNQAIYAVKKGSNIVLVGYSKSGKMTLETSLALDKEITFKTVFRYRHIYPI